MDLTSPRVGCHLISSTLKVPKTVNSIVGSIARTGLIVGAD